MNNVIDTDDQVKDKVRRLLDKQANSGHHTLRTYKDIAARYGIAIGGVSVIVAVLMIFFYLLYVVVPIFSGAELAVNRNYSLESDDILLWGTEEYGEVGFRYSSTGNVVFFNAHDGQPLNSAQLPLDPDERLTAASFANREDNIVAVATDAGRILVVRQAFNISYPNDQRLITPAIEFPFGERWFTTDGQAIKHLVAAKGEEFVSLVAANAANQLHHFRFDLIESFIDDTLSLEEVLRETVTLDIEIDYLAHDPAGQWVYAVSKQGSLQSLWYDEKLVINETLSLVDQGNQVTAFSLLLGGTSLLVGDEYGQIAQWFQIRDASNNFRLNKIRSFALNDSPIINITPELRRKGFFAVDNAQTIGVFFTTSHRRLLTESLPAASDQIEIAINPRATHLLTLQQGQVTEWSVDNEHPDLSWSALWSKVWYEDYQEPEYTWQSSASNTDFEAKFSLVPLSFGTLKAAFYAMLFAMPLAICGAIFTAYFMAPRMRQMVKPAVEVMEALPTVILGFLAGLWLAPALEANLPGVFVILFVMPLVFMLVGLVWYYLPIEWRARIPEGWQAGVLIPVIVLFCWLCFEVSYPLEVALFDGNMPAWLDKNGITFDQRNSMVVGIAMGFAVIPTIFSIAEDAIFSVPRHLTSGSLALGASPWQTLVRVVLPTASPGIFSAVMIGLGRAVGETMIVLMATGNTPIMEANIFEGMRTLSANIAVEMPESAVGSSHYRVLFLAGFVLFVFTFVFNTVAESVRHRLRRKYGSL